MLKEEKTPLLPTSVLSWLEEFQKYPERFPVSPNENFKLNKTPLPQNPEPIDEIFTDFLTDVVPGVNFWNHPGFMAYFNSSATEAGIIAEMLTAAINANCMTYQSCPVGTELEILTIDWLKEMLNLPTDLWGIIYEGGSSSNFHALVAARNKLLGEEFRSNGIALKTKPLSLYFSNQTHSSIEKSALILGIGSNGIRKIKTNDDFSINISTLNKTIQEDIENGFRPFCVVANLGSTSCTAVDDIKVLAHICDFYDIWLHVDASHGGALAMLDEKKELFAGWERADSITINPHKWFFVPLDLSVLLLKNPHQLKEAFSIEAEYLKNLNGSDKIDFMDYGISLGRRFRALKLWFTIKYLGIETYKSILKNHLNWAQWLKGMIEDHEKLEINAPVMMSTVCFSIKDKNQDLLQKNFASQLLLKHINDSNHFFVTHTKLNGVFVIRIVISSYRVDFSTIQSLWKLIKKYLQ